MKKLLTLLVVLAILVSPALAESSEPVTLTAWGINDGSMTDVNTNDITIWAEEQTGIHIEWTVVSQAESETQLNLLIAGGKYPDMIVSGVLSPSQVITYANAGVIIPLTDLIEEYGVNYKRMLEENPSFRDYITAPDGNIYTSMRTDPGHHMYSMHKMWMNTDWINNLGLSMPTTTEEFRAVLTAFRDQDANGNGDATDEIPLMGSIGNLPIAYLMNPFQLWSDDYLLALDGQVTFTASTDGWREGLKYINSLYKDGLIAEETFVQDGSQLSAITSVADPASRIVGSFPGLWQGTAASASVMPGAWDIYQPVEPLTGPTGLKQAEANDWGSICMQGVITSACTQPELAFQWLDFWLSDEASNAVDYGLVDSGFVWSDEPSVDGQVPSRLRLAPPTDAASGSQNYKYTVSIVPYYRTEASLYSRTPTDHVPYLYEGAKAYAPYYTSTGFGPFLWIEDESVMTQIDDFKLLFKDYVEAFTTNAVLGIVDINDDNVWNSYLDELNAMGLETYLSLMSGVVFTDK